MGPWPWGTAAVEKWGKTERRPRGFDSPPHLELGWSEAGCPRRRADGGGAASVGKE